MWLGRSTDLRCLLITCMERFYHLLLCFILKQMELILTNMSFYTDAWRRMETHGDARRRTETHGDAHRRTQMHADERRCTQTHADKRRHTQTNAKQTASGVWADATSRRIQTLDVCSRTFGMYYMLVWGESSLFHEYFNI